ncbi:MAG: nitronate monooxygenase [Pseudomonadota bacterium]
MSDHLDILPVQTRTVIQPPSCVVGTERHNQSPQIASNRDGCAERIERVTLFIEENLDQTLDVDTLAGVAAYSPYHFSRVFKSVTGCSPSRFIRRMRVAKAMDLTRETDVPLSEIAFTCGFGSQSHLTSTMKIETGSTPGAIRKKAIHRKAGSEKVSRQRPLDRAKAFASRFGFDLPILMAPMTGVFSIALAAGVANAGGMAASGVLLQSPGQIEKWVKAFRAASNGALQLNTWVPDPAPQRSPQREAEMRAFLGQWGPEVPPIDNLHQIDFDGQCQAMLEARPQAISSVMGLYDAAYVREMKSRDIAWSAIVTTVSEARTAEAAGADVIVAQGAEAGGHRGTFDAACATASATGLFALVPAVVDAVNLPVIATGGIADARTIVAALHLGASAVQIGTGLLRTPEAGLPSSWTDGLATAQPDDTVITTAFSGRPGRSLRTAFVEEMSTTNAPASLPYPVQRQLTGPMRKAAQQTNTIDGLQAWAGQAARLGRTAPVSDVVRDLWAEAQETI